MTRYLQFLVLLFAFGISNAYAQGDLQITLSQPPSTSDQQVGRIVLTLTNTGKEPVAILKWKTPFIEAGGRLPNSLFVIVDAKGQRVAYTGRNVKFVNMTADSFLTLEPGQSVSKVVDLAQDYAISDGAYKVMYTQDLSAKPPVKSGTGQQVKAIPPSLQKSSPSNTLDIWVNTSLLGGKRQQAMLSRLSATMTVASTPCSALQQTVLNAALGGAQALGTSTYSYINSIMLPPDGSADPVSIIPSGRFALWLGNMGPIHQSDYQGPIMGTPNTITTGFFMSNFLIGELQSGNINLVCNTCDGYDPNAAAFAETTTQYVIDICPAYYNQPLNGVDSQSGIVIHELSHFPSTNGSLSYPGTTDIAYGQAAAQALAASNMAEADANADNYEYFFENAPGVSQ